MLCAMNSIQHSNHSSLSFAEKTISPKLVAYTRFWGVLNAPSRMWMVRDWAMRAGCSLVGPPQCVFYPEEADPELRQCEVQWQIADAMTADGGEISSRWLDPAPVIAAYHPGKPSAIRDTRRALEAWGRANGYRLTGACCEVYYRDVQAPPEHWITEIQLFIDGACRTFELSRTSGRAQRSR